MKIPDTQTTIALLMVLAAGCVIWYFQGSFAPVVDHVPAQVAPQIKGVNKVDITPAKLRVYDQKAKVKLKLPDHLKNDQHIFVVEATRVPADDHPSTVTTLVNKETGETQTVIRREPLPWLALKNTGEIRLDYGITRGVDRVARLSIRQDLLQVKALYAGVNASLDSDGMYFVGVGVGYRW